MAGTWGAISYLRLTKESTFGTFDGSASAGNILWIRLHQSNAFTMRPKPIRQEIRSADGGNRRRQVVAARSMCEGSLVTPTYATQANALLTWATTLSSNDIPSFTCDHYDSVRWRRYLGTKIKQYKMVSNASIDYLVTSLGLVAQRADGSDPTVSAPASTVFPGVNELPYLHQESSTYITLGGVALTDYKNFDLTVDNILDGQFNELPYISTLRYCGRNVELGFSQQYSSTALRASYEAQDELGFIARWNRPSPAHSMQISFASTSYISDLSDDLPLDGTSYQNVTAQVNFSDTSSTDLAITVS